MDKLQTYFKEALGIEVKLIPLPKDEQNKLPLYLRNKLKTCEILGRDLIFAIQTNEANFTPEQYQKQSDIIENTLEKNVVFVFENMELYNRKRLIQKKVAFIVPGRQMYIPFLLIELREFNKTQTKKTEKLFPAAQCLLFYYLLGNKVTGMNFKMLAEKLNYGKMTITRAANTLTELNLCKIEGGKDKTLIFEKDKPQLWKDAITYLIIPFDKQVYTDDAVDPAIIFKTDITALAHYTNIAANGKLCYAVSQLSYKNLLEMKNIRLDKNGVGNTCLQIWKYDPGILTSDNFVDPLSLYMTFTNYEDERVQGELYKFLDNLW